MTDTTDLEHLVVLLEANADKLSQQIQELSSLLDRQLTAMEQRVNSFQSNIESGLQDAFGGLAGQITGAFSAAAIVDFIAKAAEGAQALEALSQRTVTSTDDIQALDRVATQNNVSFGDMNSALDIFAKRLGDASTGQGQLAQVMREYGIKPGQDLMTTFLAVADAVKNAKNVTDEYRITTQAFGRDDEGLVNMLSQGGAAIADQMQAVKDSLGGIMSTDTVHNLAQFAQSWTEIRETLANIGSGTASSALVLLSDFLDGLARGDWEQKADHLVALLGAMAGNLPGLLFGGADLNGSALDAAINKVNSLQSALQNAQLNVNMGGLSGPVAAAVQSDVANIQQQLADAEAKVNQLSNPQTTFFGPTKPFSSGSAPDPKAMQILIAGMAAVNQATQGAQSAYGAYIKTIDDGNADAAKNTDAYYDDLETTANDAYANSITQIQNELTTKTDALSKIKNTDYPAYVAAVEKLDQEAALKGAAAEQTKDNAIEQIGQQRLQRDQQIADQESVYEAARVAAVQQLQEATDAAYVAMSKGTTGYYDALRQQADDQYSYELANLDKQQAAEIAAYQKTADGKAAIANGNMADINAIYAKYDALRQAAGVKDATAQSQINEQQTQVLQNQISVMDSLRNGLEDIRVTSIKSWSDFTSALGSALDGVVDLIVQLYVLKPLVESLFGPAGTVGGGSAGGILGDLLGGGYATQGANGVWATAPGGFPDTGAGGLLSLFGFAQGGVMTSRGAMPLRRYAGGGVANSPQLAMFGEGGGAEAYVPLPDGRSIPVSIRIPSPSQMSAIAAPPSSVNTKLDWTLHITGTTDQEILTQARVGTANMLAAYDKLLPQRVSELVNDPRRRY